MRPKVCQASPTSQSGMCSLSEAVRQGRRAAMHLYLSEGAGLATTTVGVAATSLLMLMPLCTG